MELRRLELFVAFVEEGTVTAAAERVRLAQPALSRQLAALEKELRVRLFERSQNRLRLTPAGRDFVPAARELLAHAAQTRAAARALADGVVQELVLAAPSATLTELVAPYLATLPPTAPLVLAREVATPDAYAALNTGTDLAISPAPPEGPLAQISLGTVPVRAYVAREHPWAIQGRTQVTLEELARQRLFVLPRDHTSRIELELAVTRAGLSFSELVECDVARVIQAHAAAGRGVGFVTDYPQFDVYGVTVASDASEGAAGARCHPACRLVAASLRVAPHRRARRRTGRLSREHPHDTARHGWMRFTHGSGGIEFRRRLASLCRDSMAKYQDPYLTGATPALTVSAGGTAAAPAPTEVL